MFPLNFFFVISLSYSLELTLNIVNNWSKISFTEKLNYLLLDNDWYQYHLELESLGKGFEVTKEIFYNSLIEFQSENIIEKFWNVCDNNKDNLLELEEYVICRGEADRNGNPYERNEYEYREQVIMSQFWEKASLSKDQPELYRYDENGIIIDE